MWIVDADGAGGGDGAGGAAARRHRRHAHPHWLRRRSSSTTSSCRRHEWHLRAPPCRSFGTTVPTSACGRARNPFTTTLRGARHRCAGCARHSCVSASAERDGSTLSRLIGVARIKLAPAHVELLALGRSWLQRHGSRVASYKRAQSALLPLLAAVLWQRAANPPLWRSLRCHTTIFRVMDVEKDARARSRAVSGVFQPARRA